MPGNRTYVPRPDATYSRDDGATAAPPTLVVRMVENSPTSLQLTTGQVLDPGTTVVVTEADWAAMSPETRAATHRLLTDPKRQTALLGGRYITPVSPEHPTPEEIRP
ncbi:MAG: hypothetical protein WKF57_10560 [Nakamurella sp.]